MRILALALGLALPLTACGAAAGTGSDDHELTVLAASSLGGAFGDLAAQFERDHPGVTVRLVLESSTTLATQAADGAPGDVIATADEASMQIVTDAGATRGRPVPFATNSMVLAVPVDDPADIRSLGDLGRPDVDWVMCDPSAPCGKASRALLRANHLTADPASLEVDATAVLGKVTSADADAALVYRTDATSAGDRVRTLPVPHADDHRNPYYLAALTDHELASEWIALVTGRAGQAVLRRAGFGGP